MDAEALAALSNLPGFRHGTARLPYTAPEQTREFIDRAPPGGMHLVAELDREIIGQGGLLRLQGRQGHCADLYVGVHDDWTGRGVGTALMAALVDSADRWLAIRRLQLTVYCDNAGAIALYRRFGFETEGTMREHALRDGVFADSYAMARLGGPWRPVSS